MDVSIELDRIFPVPLLESDLSTAKDELLTFLIGLSKKEYEIALGLLPDKPKLEFEDTEEIHGGSWLDLYVTSVKQRFWDVIAAYSIIYYGNHVSTTDIISHLLKGKKKRPGNGLRSLAGKLSSTERISLFEQLLSFEEKDAKGRPLTQGKLEDYLENQFPDDRIRIGMMEYALEELLDTYNNTSKKNKTRGTITGHLEQHILEKIQQKRRTEFLGRIGKIDSVNKARFACDEVHRELFRYPRFDPEYVRELCEKIYYWYQHSKASEKIRKNMSVTEYGWVLDDFLHIGRRIGLAHANGVSDISTFIRPHWNKIIGQFLPSETFWHSMQGLNSEVPLEQTQAGRDIASFRLTAGIIGAAYVAVILLPLAVAVGIRAPGAVVSVIRWTGGRLLLGTQYVYTTITVLGVKEGTQRMVADVYHFYLRNPISINKTGLQVTEIVLDLTGNGTGLPPGSSPADLSAAATQKIRKLAKMGISKLADDALAVARGPEVEIEKVEMVVKDPDSIFYRVIASVKGGDENVMRLNVDHLESLGKQIDLDTQMKVKFQMKPRNDNSVADARGTANSSVDIKQTTAVDAVATQELTATGTDGAAIMMGSKTMAQKPVVGRATSTTTSNRNATMNNRGTSNQGTGSAKLLTSIPNISPILESRAGYSIVADLNAPQLDPLKKAGFKFELIPAKSQKTGGGRFQKRGTEIDSEWRITAPSGVKADIDGLAIDPLKPSGLIAVEAKATFVGTAEKSAHLIFYPGKVEQLTRQLAVALESKGVMRIEILCNADSVAETYLNIAVQQMALELRKHFRQQAKAYIESTTDKMVKRIPLADFERIVDESISVVVSHWGQIKASK